MRLACASLWCPRNDDQPEDTLPRAAQDRVWDSDSFPGVRPFSASESCARSGAFTPEMSTVLGGNYRWRFTFDLGACMFVTIHVKEAVDSVWSPPLFCRASQPACPTASRTSCAVSVHTLGAHASPPPRYLSETHPSGTISHSNEISLGVSQLPRGLRSAQLSFPSRATQAPALGSLAAGRCWASTRPAPAPARWEGRGGC